MGDQKVRTLGSSLKLAGCGCTDLNLPEVQVSQRLSQWPSNSGKPGPQSECKVSLGNLDPASKGQVKRGLVYTQVGDCLLSKHTLS